MSRLPGVPPGKTIAPLHQLPPPDRGLAACGLASFRGRQRAWCVSEQRALNLPALSADQMPMAPRWVELPAPPPVLLHTESCASPC
jgi:hypothetical protein